MNHCAHSIAVLSSGLFKNNWVQSGLFTNYLCSDILIGNITDFTCSADDPLFHTPYFPLSSTKYSTAFLNNSLPEQEWLDVPCYSGDGACDPPLVESQGGCSFVCPLPSLPDKTVFFCQDHEGRCSLAFLGLPFLHILILLSIIASSVGTEVLIISSLLNPATWQFPKNLVLMIALAANVLVNRFFFF